MPSSLIEITLLDLREPRSAVGVLEVVEDVLDEDVEVVEVVLDT